MASSNSTPLKVPDQRSKSCETACSSNSSCFFKRRKPINPLATSVASRSTANSVRQRVLSAKLLKLKSVQNQLNDVNYHLAEVIRENQALKTLQKRQDKALSKYEGENAELPRLIQSHEEEIRFLTEKNKILRRSVKELNEQLKHKSDELVNVQEQLRHYEKLDRDKHLLEREKLLEEVDDLKMKLKKADNDIVVLNRKLTLESKTSKQRLNAEMAKHKQCQRELAQALSEIGRLTSIIQDKEKPGINGKKRFSNLIPRQSQSLISLNGNKLISEDRAPVTEVKLERLSQPDYTRPYKGILKCPSESIKARLSAESRKDEDDLPSVDKLSLSGSETSIEKETQSRPGSHHKLEKLESSIHNTIKKIESDDEFSRKLGDYCLKAVDSVKTCSAAIETHKENLTFAQKDTKKIEDTVKDIESIEKRLKDEAKLISSSGDGFDFVSEILQEEADFQANFKSRNGKKDPVVKQNDKQKLLATLRAIDNGDSVDSFDGDSQQKHLMKELFN